MADIPVIYRLTRPIRTDTASISAIALRAAEPADKGAILAVTDAERRRLARQPSKFTMAAIMVAQLADVPLEHIRKLAVADLQALTVIATNAFAKAGMS